MTISLKFKYRSGKDQLTEKLEKSKMNDAKRGEGKGSEMETKEVLKVCYATRDSICMLLINANECACMVVYQSNKAS